MKKYQTYMFKDQDPMVEKVLRAVDGNSFSAISRGSGVSSSTPANWKRKKTKRPQHATMAAVLGYAGLEFKIGKKER